MFNFDTEKYLSDYSSAAKNAMTMVYPSELRAILGRVVDLQVDTAKLVTKVVTESAEKAMKYSK